MEPEITIQQPLSLGGFCRTIIESRPANWPPSERTIDHEFVSFFEVNGMLNLERLETICTRLQISVSQRQLPYPLRGHNSTYQEKREIVVGTVSSSADYLGISAHTLLHELRELIEHEFRKQGFPVAPSPVDLESRAEQFASEVRSLASLKDWEWVFEDIGNIKSGFWRAVAILAASALMMLHHFSFLNLSQWEERLAK